MKAAVSEVIMSRFACCLVICFVTASCASDISSSNYGIVTLQLENGKKVYFKREVWGLNGHNFVISVSPDLCSMPKPTEDKSETDYVYNGMDPPILYYKINGDELTLYSTTLPNPPTKTPFPVKIVQNELTTIDIIRLRDKAPTLGLKEIKVEIDRSLACK